MSAKMYVDDKVYNIYRLQFGFHQEINTNGTAASHPLGGLFDIELDSPKDPHLYAWGASNYQMKHVKLVFSQITKATRSRTIELYDTLCIGHHDYFSNGSKDPMRSVLKLSPAIIMQDGKIMFEKNWKVTDLSRQNVEPTPLPVTREDDEPQLVRYFITDVSGNELEEYEAGDKIVLQIETENRIGDMLCVNLNDKTHDFKYNGMILENDTIQNYTINSNLEQIELEVIDQQN
ncbi:MAG: hypothetical protein JKX79_07845 [Labilibaculum sp.]|nr:hypothetical protein [Labilibaculum sp.]